MNPLTLIVVLATGDVAFQPGISAEDIGSEGRVPVLESASLDPGNLFLDFSIVSMPGATVGVGWDFYVTDTMTVSLEGELGYWQVDQDEVTKTWWAHDPHGKKNHERDRFSFGTDDDIATFMVKATVWQSLVTDDHLGWQVYGMLGVGGGDGMLWEFGGGVGYRWGDLTAYGGPLLFDGDEFGIELGLKWNW